MQGALDFEYFSEMLLWRQIFCERMLHTNNGVRQSGAVCCEKALWYVHCILSLFSKTFLGFIIAKIVLI